VAWALGGAAAATASGGGGGGASGGGSSRSRPYLLLLFRGSVASGSAWLTWLALGEARADAAAEAERIEREQREQQRRGLPSPTRRSTMIGREGGAGADGGGTGSSASATATATIFSSPSRGAKASGTIEQAGGKDFRLLPPPSLRALAAAALALAAAARAASSAPSSCSSSRLVAFAFTSLSASLSVSLTHFLLKRAPKSFTLGEASAVACCAALALADAAAVSLSSSSSSSVSSSSASLSASLEALFAGSTRSPESRFVQRVVLGTAAGATLAVPLLRAAFLVPPPSPSAATTREEAGTNKRRNRSIALALLFAGAAFAARPLLRDATWALLFALGSDGKSSSEGPILSWKPLQLGSVSVSSSSSSFFDGDGDGGRASRRRRIVSAWALALLVALPLLHCVAAPPLSSTAEGAERPGSPPPGRRRKGKGKAAGAGRWPRPPTILLRKAYHVLALAMFAPAALLSPSSGGADPGLLCVGLAVAAAALFAAEACRASGLPLLGIGPAVARFMGRFVDARDEGALLVSHFSLLLGMAGPLWLLSPGGSEGGGGPAALAVALSLAGVVSLGTVDAAASAVGRAIGRRKLFGTQKTLEGTLAGAASGALAWAVLWPRLRLLRLEAGGGGAARPAQPLLRRWLSPTAAATSPLPLPLSAAVLASALSALMEASTTQLDNVFLPLHHLAVLGALARLLS